VSIPSPRSALHELVGLTHEGRPSSRELLVSGDGGKGGAESETEGVESEGGGVEFEVVSGGLLRCWAQVHVQAQS
jgi:hypothetical protein